MNNNGAVSTDFIGANWLFPNASYADRLVMWQAHLNYTQEFLWFVATDSAVPMQVRNRTATLGLCRDEFAASGNWPTQLYIREARRMVGDTVFTQNSIIAGKGVNATPGVIGMGSYNFDSHNAQRFACVNRTTCTAFTGVPYVSSSALTLHFFKKVYSLL